MVRDLLLTVAIPFNSFKDHLSPLCSGCAQSFFEQSPQGGSIRIPLAPGNLGNAFVFLEAIGKIIHEGIFTQERLPTHLTDGGRGYEDK